MGVFCGIRCLGAGIGVGLASSVVPYVFDQLAMARLQRETYSLMVSLLPATATVIGVVVLAQVPHAVEIAGVAPSWSLPSHSIANAPSLCRWNRCASDRPDCTSRGFASG